MKKNWMVVIATMLLTAAMQDAAAAEPALRMSGVVQSWSGGNLLLKTAEGEVHVSVPASVTVTRRRSITLADIRSGLFVGSAAVRAPDGTLHASEIHVIPEALRGGTGGQRPMAAPNTMMTNGSIQTMTNGSVVSSGSSAGGFTMKLSFPDGEQQIVVAPDTPVTSVDLVDVQMLKAGLQVNVTGSRGAGDTVLAERIDIMPAPPQR